MAEQNWYSNGNVDWNATNAWNTQADGLGTALTDPDTDAHVIIQGSDTITITAAIGNTIKSLTIDSGSDLDGHASHIIETTAEGDASFGSNGYAVKINGTTDSNVNITVGGTFSTLVDLDGTMGNLILKGAGSKQFRGTPTIGGNVTIQDSCPVDCAGAVQINGNFTITSGSYDTGSDHALTVTGKTSVSGTLTCNASDITLGTGKTDDWALSIGTTGTFTGGTGTHIIGSISTTAWGSPSITLSSGATTINSKYTSNGYSINCAAGTTFAHGGGSVIMTYDGNTLIQYSGGTLAFNDLTYNAAARTLTLEGPISCAGYLKILAGTLDTKSAENNALTVEEYTQVSLSAAADSATLATNDSVCQFGASGYTSEYGLLVQQGGTVTCGTASAAWTASSIYMNGSYTTLTFTRGVCTVTSQVGSGLNNSLDLNGIVVHNSGTVTLTIAAATSLDINGSSGDLNNLIINHSSCVATLLTTTNIDNDLTITAGELDTGADLALTVTGNTNVTGTLTCNASTVSLGSGYLAGYGLDGAGTVNLGTGTNTIGACNFSGNGLTKTSGTVDFDTRNTGGASIGTNPASANNTWNFGTSTVNFTTDGAGSIFQIEMHSGSGNVFQITCGTLNINQNARLYNSDTDNNRFTIDGDCNIASTKSFSTYWTNNFGTAFWVTGDLTVTGTFNGNSTAHVCSHSFGSLTIAGTFNATSGTTTLTGPDVDDHFLFQNSGTFTHNKGTVIFSYTSYANCKSGGDAFYNLISDVNHGQYVGIQNTDALEVMNDFTINANDGYTCAIGTTTVHGNVYCYGNWSRYNTSSKTQTIKGTLTIGSSGWYRPSSGTNNLGGIRNLGGSVN